MATYKQQHAKSCGAACLMVAAHELGITNLPAYGQYWFGEPLALSSNIESKIYLVTGLGGQSMNDVSMPDGIARAAQAMGMQVTVYMHGVVIPKVLNKAYPKVMGSLADLGVAVKQGNPKLEHDERMLIVVTIGALPILHYVLYRPDGTYMDPAKGADYNWFVAMGQGYVFWYVNTGIYIVVRRGSMV
jgi:hypothetical protein